MLSDRYVIPIASETIFRGRLLIMTGVGRSGTSILGKLVGSMKPSFYLFEPAVMKLIPFMCTADTDNTAVYANVFQSLLFEDYFLQVIHGRHLNFNERNDSFAGHYLLKSDIEKRWEELAGRQDVIDYIASVRPLFISKSPEFQPLCALAQRILPAPKFVHIIRNGNDVVSSTMRRGWYTDAYMNASIVDWVEKRSDAQGCNVPWYIDEESKSLFPGWNHTTRAACVWRCLTESGMAFHARNAQDSLQFTYEELVASPERYVDLFASTFGLEATEITAKHITSIRQHTKKNYVAVQNDIQAPERSKFLSLMEKLNYC